jgi:plastocyanin
LSATTSSHAYGIGLMAIIIGASVGVVYYTSFYLPESLAKPKVAEEILKPIKSTAIEMIPNSSNKDQQDNFVPKLINIQLGIDNHIVWTNKDTTPHTVTPDDASLKDPYSGPFGSPGVVKPGESYEFTFTTPLKFSYHCSPHPWMTGSLEITQSRI